MWHRTPWVDSERRNWDKLAAGEGGSGGDGNGRLIIELTNVGDNTWDTGYTTDELIELCLSNVVYVKQILSDFEGDYTTLLPVFLLFNNFLLPYEPNADGLLSSKMGFVTVDGHVAFTI